LYLPPNYSEGLSDMTDTQNVQHTLDTVLKSVEALKQTMSDDFKSNEKAILETYIRLTAVELMVRELVKDKPEIIDNVVAAIESSTIYGDSIKEELKTFTELFKSDS
jgi:hypothetical protein